MHNNIPFLWIIAPLGAILGFNFCSNFFRQVKKQDPGNAKMQKLQVMLGKVLLPHF